MDEIEISEEEHKDRVKFFNICERSAKKLANKHCKSDEDRILFVQELAIAFLGNMTFRFFNQYATKQDFLMMIEIITKSLQMWYVDVLNQTNFEKRINLQ